MPIGISIGMPIGMYPQTRLDTAATVERAGHAGVAHWSQRVSGVIDIAKQSYKLIHQCMIHISHNINIKTKN